MLSWHCASIESNHAKFKDILGHIARLGDLNARLWAWLEQVYHRRPHASLDGSSLLARYQQDLSRIRPLGPLAAKLDILFRHCVSRLARKDGTVSYHGKRFEVPFELSGQTVSLVVDPHTEVVIGVEDEEGKAIGAATPLDALANATRRRRQPDPAKRGSADRCQPRTAASEVRAWPRQGRRDFLRWEWCARAAPRGGLAQASETSCCRGRNVFVCCWLFTASIVDIIGAFRCMGKGRLLSTMVTAKLPFQIEAWSFPGRELAAHEVHSGVGIPGGARGGMLEQEEPLAGDEVDAKACGVGGEDVAGLRLSVSFSWLGAKGSR